MRHLAFSVVGILLLIGSAHAETATIKMRFKVERGVPTRLGDHSDTVRSEDISLRKGKLKFDPISEGIQNVVVYVDDGRGNANLNVAPHKSQKRNLTIANDQFEPTVLFARAGDTLRISNKSQQRHSPHILSLNAPGLNVDLLPGQVENMKLPAPAPSITIIDCDTLPDAQALLITLDHPYAAVSDEKGNVTLEGLPVGTKLRFRVYHQAVDMAGVKPKGLGVKLKRDRFEATLREGMNDIGDIVMHLSVVRN
jgi:hypothetical protein